MLTSWQSWYPKRLQYANVSPTWNVFTRWNTRLMSILTNHRFRWVLWVSSVGVLMNEGIHLFMEKNAVQSLSLYITYNNKNQTNNQNTTLTYHNFSILDMLCKCQQMYPKFFSLSSYLSISVLYCLISSFKFFIWFSYSFAIISNYFYIKILPFVFPWI